MGSFHFKLHWNSACGRLQGTQNFMDHSSYKTIWLKSIKWSIAASDVFLVPEHLNMLTTDNFKLKCPIKWTGMETADWLETGQRVRHLAWRKGPTGTQHGFPLPLYRDVRRAFIWQRGDVLCSALRQSRKGDITFGDRRCAGCTILLSS